MKLKNTGKHDHNWGIEINWTNSENYSGKLLVFPKAGAKTDLIVHKNRRKSWFVNAGKFKISLIDVKTGQLKETILEEGKIADLSEMSPHRLEAMEPNSIIFEVGTADDTTDTFILDSDVPQKSSEEPK